MIEVQAFLLQAVSGFEAPSAPRVPPNDLEYSISNSLYQKASHRRCRDAPGALRRQRRLSQPPSRPPTAKGDTERIQQLAQKVSERLRTTDHSVQLSNENSPASAASQGPSTSGSGDISEEETMEQAQVDSVLEHLLRRKARSTAVRCEFLKVRSGCMDQQGGRGGACHPSSLPC